MPEIVTIRLLLLKIIAFYNSTNSSEEYFMSKTYKENCISNLSIFIVLDFTKVEVILEQLFIGLIQKRSNLWMVKECPHPEVWNLVYEPSSLFEDWVPKIIMYTHLVVYKRTLYLV